MAPGTRFQLPNVNPADRDRSLTRVTDALQVGEPYRRWLLIFDNVRQPEQVIRYIPCSGHVIVTSRVSTSGYFWLFDDLNIRAGASLDDGLEAQDGIVGLSSGGAVTPRSRLGTAD